MYNIVFVQVGYWWNGTAKVTPAVRPRQRWSPHRSFKCNKINKPQEYVSSSYFYPRDAMLARVIEIATCLSVRLSIRHTPVLCQNEES